MIMNFTHEQLTKAKSAKSAEELLILAKENGVELSEEEAKNYFEQWHKEGELADEELDNVAGGTCYSDGIWGPYGKQHYAIVTVGNSCPKCDVVSTGGHFDNCLDCSKSFSAGATLYCSIRTEDNDPYSD